MHAIMCMWRSEDNLQELALFFHHVGPRDGTQVIKLGSKHLCVISAALICFLCSLFSFIVQLQVL